MLEPELIEVLEGPTPDFMPAPHVTLQMVHEGPLDAETAFCELRTGNGEDIMERCRNAWKENRPVKLDFPDEIRMRQQVDVVAARLREVDEGTILMLWVRLPIEEEEVEEFDLDDGDDDGLNYF